MKIEDILEINKIKENILLYAKTPVGQGKIINLKPSNDFKFIQKELNKLKEFNSIIDKNGEVPIYSEIDMYKEIEHARKGFSFDEIKLNLVKTDIQNTIDIIKYSMKLDFDPIYLNDLFLGLKANEILYNRINQSISSDNQVKDSASRELAQIRKDIYNLNKSIHSSLSSLISKFKDITKGDNFVIRNGRYAIPISTSYKGDVDGIVQDVSDSGQTTFIEPKEVLEQENRMTVLKIREKDEISKILHELTNLVLANREQLISNNEIIAEIDFLNSKCKYQREIDANIPLINNKHYFSLINAKHPLIDKEKCVANDFKLGKDQTLMIISGPNAGGKTIALKTVAILSYMVKLGLAIPASPDSEICIFNKIYCDIGDSQSLENNLSTFSAHISNFSRLFKEITQNDLVILDELCSGTDPKEGEALAVAFVKYLLKTNALCMVTSHYPLLKKYGFTNPQIMNASFLFNEKNITPTFKILLGVSGKSYGFLIAKKFGIDEKIIQDAKIIYDKSFESENDKKIAAIDEKERYLLQKDEKLKQRQENLAKEKEELLRKEKELKQKEMSIKNQKLDKFDKFLNDKYNEINNIFEEFLKDQNIKKAEAKLDKINVNKKKNENIELNQYIAIKSLGIEGKVTRIQGNKITVTSKDGFSINTTKDACEIIEPPKEVLKSTINVDNYILNQKSVSQSINLVGYRVDEAIIALDKYLDDCILRGLKEVKIIHGYGSGKLRMGIHDFLKNKSSVKSFHIGNELEGGSGSTICILK